MMRGLLNERSRRRWAAEARFAGAGGPPGSRPWSARSLSAPPAQGAGSPTSFAYQWQDCNTSGANCTPISRATASTFTLAAGDVRQFIRSVVSATNAAKSTPATSNPTGVVSAFQPPPLAAHQHGSAYDQEDCSRTGGRHPSNRHSSGWSRPEARRPKVTFGAWIQRFAPFVSRRFCTIAPAVVTCTCLDVMVVGVHPGGVPRIAVMRPRFEFLPPYPETWVLPEQRRIRHRWMRSRRRRWCLRRRMTRSV